jgi:hypothetical protein
MIWRDMDLGVRTLGGEPVTQEGGDEAGLFEVGQNARVGDGV